MHFQIRLIPTLAMLLGMALFIYLGAWQTGKGDRLEAELAQHALRGQLGPTVVTGQMLDAQAAQDAPLLVTGTFEAQHQIFLDNRQENGQPGVHVITPLHIDGSDTRILVNRGWIGWSQGRSVLPVVPTPLGRVQVVGLGVVPSTKKFFLMPDHPDAQTKLWTRVDMPRFASMIGHPLQPVVLEQTGGDVSDTLVRHWGPPEDRVGKHRGYAFQWFGMAAALLLFYLVASFRKGERS
ncbi:MAG: SURF1 family protein [Rhodoferax sp.]|uniref:SURF1 family protein n=1 Tax=Rhodoferax sp. TaxID=50421 RepID=UPI0026209BDF|nr:SURF1 family protein [Rhodoferax sp.]MDD2879590.1 SURF1 family protein [Rhodoferax sp.]